MYLSFFEGVYYTRMIETFDQSSAKSLLEISSLLLFFSYVCYILFPTVSVAAFLLLCHHLLLCFCISSLFVSSCFPSLYVYVLSFSSSLGRLWPFPYVPVPLSVDRFCRSLSAMTVERSLLDGCRRLSGRLCGS